MEKLFSLDSLVVNGINIRKKKETSLLREVISLLEEQMVIDDEKEKDMINRERIKIKMTKKRGEH